MVVETEFGVKVYAGSKSALAGVTKSVHFHDWWALSLTHRGILSWFKSLICVLKAIQRVWMSWGTDSSHWMANCHKFCRSFAITMTRRARGLNNLATSESMIHFDITWLLYQVCRKIGRILALIPLHAQNIWVRNIISDNDWHTVTIVFQ